MHNSFGTIFKITTWGESHGKALGVVIDGCPAGLPLDEEDIRRELKSRRPGNSPYTSPRKEEDEPEILSGVFEGRTTGAPISIVIYNRDPNSKAYEPIKDLLRPGHAHFTYLEKYGIFDYRGGGRASGRETVCRVAAGAVAKKLLADRNVSICAYISAIGGVAIDSEEAHTAQRTEKVRESAIFCPDPLSEREMIAVIEKAREEGDSVGGIVECWLLSLPAGLGDPIYEKLEANLAKAMLSLPAAKGFEIGSGFAGAGMRGSEHNDLFCVDGEGKVRTQTNHAGGTLGGISTGMPLVFRVAFKPPSSIQKLQQTLTAGREPAVFSLPEGSRHDPCVAIRAVPVVEAMAALVCADALLINRTSKL